MTSRRRFTGLSGIRLQPRDIDLIRLVFSHHFARSDHLLALRSPSISRRVLQARLQKLYRHGYLHRRYIPIVLDGLHAPATHSRQPIYAATPRGLALLSEESPTRFATVLPVRSERPSAHHLTHHLVVTDCLVALAVQSSRIPEVELLSGEPERFLWPKLRAYRRTHPMEQAIVPDGVFTLRYRATNETATFYLEVVRADVRGGTASLGEKLRRYVELNRQGFFRAVYGHEHLRAVLFATTSLARSKNLARLARKLTHGRRLFWFGAYQGKTTAGRLTSCFTPDHILTLPWKTTDGERLTILEPRAVPPTGDVHP